MVLQTATKNTIDRRHEERDGKLELEKHSYLKTEKETAGISGQIMKKDDLEKSNDGFPCPNNKSHLV